MTILLCVPLFVSVLVSGAIHLVWRRRPQTVHAQTWSAAFALAAAGWLATIATDLTAPAAVALSGAAPGLCWLAAAMLFVHGLRQRAGRGSRAGVLAAIWAVIAVFTMLLRDLAPGMQSPLAIGAPVLLAAGLMLAAIALRPRQAPFGRLGIFAMLLLGGAAAANLAQMYLVVAAPRLAIAWADGVPAVVAIVYVALGLGAMLLLSDDLAVALERLARTDPLTGVWNRRGFDEGAPHLLDRVRRGGHPVPAAVAIADIDSFKGINDRHGHTAGDAVLVDFARLLGTAVEPGDIMARLGGEEFALLAVGVDGAQLFERVERVRETLCLRRPGGEDLPNVTVSFGVAQLLPGSLSLRDALERADKALYRAKQTGRNRTMLDVRAELAAG